MEKSRSAGQLRRRVIDSRIRIVDGLQRCFDEFGEGSRFLGVARTRSLTPNAPTESTMIKLFSGHIDDGTCTPEAEALESTVTKRAVVLLTLMFE